MRYRENFTFLFIPQLVQEAEIMMNNLIPFLKHKYGEEVLLYFTEEVKQEALEDRWDDINKRIICAIDECLEEDLEDDIGLVDAQSYLEV